MPYFQHCDTLGTDGIPPPKNDVPKNSSDRSSSRSKEVVLDENVRHSPIGAETSDEELQHANLAEADDWEPWEDEEICCASPNGIQFDQNLPLLIIYEINQSELIWNSICKIFL